MIVSLSTIVPVVSPMEKGSLSFIEYSKIIYPSHPSPSQLLLPWKPATGEDMGTEAPKEANFIIKIIT